MSSQISEGEYQSHFDDDPRPALDPALRGFLLERKTILRELALVLTRVGHNNPKRQKINRERAVKRKKLRRQLRMNDSAIASRWAELYDLEHP